MCYRTAGLPVPAALDPPQLPQLLMFPVASLLGLVYVSYIWGCYPIGWASGLSHRGELWLVASDSRMSLQESGKLEEVMKELRALRVLVKEQGERISRLEEQLGRMENGDT